MSGLPEPAAREKRWLWIMLAVLVTGGMVGALLTPLFFGHPVGPLVVLGALVGMAAYVALIIRAIVVARRRGWKMFERSVLHDVDVRDRRRVLRAIRRNTPPPPELDDLAGRAAQQITARSPLLWVFGVVLLFLVVDVAVQHGAQRVFAAIELGWMVAINGYVAWFQQCARRFLRRTRA